MSFRFSFILLPLLAVSCTTTLTPEQRQQLESRIYDSGYDSTYRSAREVMLNAGFEIRTSDYDGGVLEISSNRDKFSGGQTAAGTLVSLILPPVGDAMMEREAGYIILDTLTWPFSIIWAPWINLAHGLSEKENVRGNLLFERLGDNETRVRITLSDVTWDTNRYPRDIRHLQDQVYRQLLLKSADEYGVAEPLK